MSELRLVILAEFVPMPERFAATPEAFVAIALVFVEMLDVFEVIALAFDEILLAFVVIPLASFASNIVATPFIDISKLPFPLSVNRTTEPVPEPCAAMVIESTEGLINASSVLVPVFQTA